MRRLLRVSAKGKAGIAKKHEIRNLEEYGALDLDARVELMGELIGIGVMHVNDILQAEVRELAGDKYRRNGLPQNDRWGSQRGSVYIGEQRVPVEIPRVRNTREQKEVSLESYARLQRARPEVEDRLLKRVLAGLSCGDYKGCSDAVDEALSLSPSSVSRRVKRASQKKLRTLMERRLERHDFVALVIDGKRFGDDGIIVALGVTMKGEKIILGIIETDTENHIVAGDFLRGLIERGLSYGEGLLVVIDGARGFRKAITEVFGRYALVQRCQWHKRENIVKYLPKKLQDEYRRKLQRAYELDNYGAARKALLAIRRELLKINESAVRSFDEGFEETLTILRLGLSQELRRSLKTTNCIESLLSQVGQRTDKVDCWKNSNQRQRWTASALLEIEPRLNKISGYRQTKSLRTAIQKEITESGKMVSIKKQKEVAVA
ncbi:MAG: IS256 family transposase [Candidatus Zixiibacteriota bacterium]